MKKIKAQPTIGLFAAIYDEEGRILIKRRPEGISLPGDWDLPGGGVEAEKNIMAHDERIIGQELAREVKEEMGLDISFDYMPAMYPAVIKEGRDWAFVITTKGLYGTPKGGQESKECQYLSPEEVKALAENPVGNRIVSGWGKRMCRLILMGLVHGPNKEYGKQAKEYLREIQQKWE